jgi:hypothetical protein
MAVLGVLLVASVAVAGGWAQVSAEQPPADPPVGEETTIELEVLQHGVTPVSWPGLTVVATDAASGTVVRAAAEAVGPEGSYVAKIVFPSAGDWTLTFESAELEMAGSLPIRVAPIAAAPGVGTPAATGPAGQGIGALLLALAALGAFAVLGAGALALRSRGARGAAPAGTQASART